MCRLTVSSLGGLGWILWCHRQIWAPFDPRLPGVQTHRALESRVKIYIRCSSTLKVMIILREMSFLREFLLPFSFSVVPDRSPATHMVWRCLAGHSWTQLEMGYFFLTYFPKVSCWSRITWGESRVRWGLWRSRNRCSGRTLIKYKQSKTFQWIKLKAHINIRDKLMVQQIQSLLFYACDTQFTAPQPTSCSMNPVFSKKP